MCSGLPAVAACLVVCVRRFTTLRATSVVSESTQRAVAAAEIAVLVERDAPIICRVEQQTFEYSETSAKRRGTCVVCQVVTSTMAVVVFTSIPGQDDAGSQLICWYSSRIETHNSLGRWCHQLAANASLAHRNSWFGGGDRKSVV